MQHRQTKWLALSVGIGVIFAVSLLAGGALWLVQQGQEDAAWSAYKQKVSLGTVHDAQTRLQFFFKNVYETGRTISLMPGVRAIKGPNRANADQDVLILKRFDTASDTTIKNLYLNLASNFAISEIYCVLDGLNADQGQVPFFMYDQFVSGLTKASDQQTTDDVPDQMETYEYAYFPTAQQTLKSAHSQYDFATLADIPVVYSPTMRTCDNTQYLSKKDGDPVHAQGMISSVPLYGTNGTYRGLIAVIYRTDTLAALLLNVPFLPITDQDQAKAKEMQFDWPAKPVPMLLESAETGLQVADPRYTGIGTNIAKAQADKSPDLLTVALTVPGGKADDWHLNYWFSPGEKAGALASVHDSFSFQWLALGALAFLVLLLWVIVWNAKRRRENLLDQLSQALHLVGQGNLGVTITSSERSGGALATLESSFGGMLSAIRSIVETLKTTLESSSLVSQDLASSSEEASATLDEIRRFLDGLTSVVTSLEGLIAETMESNSRSSQAEGVVHQQMSALEGRISETAAFVEEALSSFRSAAETMGRQAQQIQTLESGSRDARQRMAKASTQLDRVQVTVGAISGIVEVIEDITAKTRLLAMNAAIEAANAGVAGRGFSIVSQHIRTLAEDTDKQSRAIAEALGDLVKTLAEARAAQDWTSEHLTALLDDFVALSGDLSVVANNMVELGAGSHDILQDLGKTKDSSHLVKESIDRMGTESAKVVVKIQELVSLSSIVARETLNLRSAIEQVGEVVQVVSTAGARNLEGVESLVRQTDRFQG